jgi:hypothetical protein
VVRAVTAIARSVKLGPGFELGPSTTLHNIAESTSWWGLDDFCQLQVVNVSG